jgi:hypothetical protein
VGGTGGYIKESKGLLGVGTQKPLLYAYIITFIHRRIFNLAEQVTSTIK